MERLLHYFPHLTSRQQQQFKALEPLYREWNSRINVISRKDISHFYLRHVLHSLAIAKYLQFVPGTSVIDVGTGGGFPGIPLAIIFPEVHFTLLDSIGKKIKVVNAVGTALKLQNITSIHLRSENHRGSYHFIVSRAVSALPHFVKHTAHLVSPVQKNAAANGILALKGGSLEDEIKPFGGHINMVSLDQWFEEPFFDTKKLIHLTL